MAYGKYGVRMYSRREIFVAAEQHGITFLVICSTIRVKTVPKNLQKDPKSAHDDTMEKPTLAAFETHSDIEDLHDGGMVNEVDRKEEVDK